MFSTSVTSLEISASDDLPSSSVSLSGSKAAPSVYFHREALILNEEETKAVESQRSALARVFCTKPVSTYGCVTPVTPLLSIERAASRGSWLECSMVCCDASISPEQYRIAVVPGQAYSSDDSAPDFFHIGCFQQVADVFSPDIFPRIMTLTMDNSWMRGVQWTDLKNQFYICDIGADLLVKEWRRRVVLDLFDPKKGDLPEPEVNSETLRYFRDLRESFEQEPTDDWEFHHQLQKYVSEDLGSMLETWKSDCLIATELDVHLYPKCMEYKLSQLKEEGVKFVRTLYCFAIPEGPEEHASKHQN
ncbi:MAG: hypothetical protein M1814_004734 [Vezdaea aestivalis]|nr:MAG: hypothetical protein M1814_004734 [Vezdaea aestivalis]